MAIVVTDPKMESYIELQVASLLGGIFSRDDLYEMKELRERFSLALMPKLGDHLVKPRPGYTHHGIYAGDGEVIHYAGFADGFSSAPVEKVSIDGFHESTGKYYIKPHPNARFSPDVIVSRAASRLNENKYGLFGNNCEHFVNWCIYDQHQSHQVDEAKRAVATAASVASRGFGPAALAVSLSDAGSLLTKYIKGDISKEKLLSEVSNVAVSSASIAYYAGFGQVVIPIPVAGALIGATVGYFVGNLLNHSGLVALGESDVVRVSRERSEEIQAVCARLVDKIRAARVQLEMATEKYFREGQKEILEAMALLDGAAGSWDGQEFSMALMRLSDRFGGTLQYATFQEFENAVMSDQPLRF